MGVDARVFAAVDKYDQIEWQSGQRWFSADYPRGHWPTIRNQITLLQERGRIRRANRLDAVQLASGLLVTLGLFALCALAGAIETLIN